MRVARSSSLTAVPSTADCCAASTTSITRWCRREGGVHGGGGEDAAHEVLDLGDERFGIAGAHTSAGHCRHFGEVRVLRGR